MITIGCRSSTLSCRVPRQCVDQTDTVFNLRKRRHPQASPVTRPSALAPRPSKPPVKASRQCLPSKPPVGASGGGAGSTAGRRLPARYLVVSSGSGSRQPPSDETRVGHTGLNVAAVRADIVARGARRVAAVAQVDRLVAIHGAEGRQRPAGSRGWPGSRRRRQPMSVPRSGVAVSRRTPGPHGPLPVVRRCHGRTPPARSATDPRRRRRSPTGGRQHCRRDEHDRSSSTVTDPAKTSAIKSTGVAGNEAGRSAIRANEVTRATHPAGCVSGNSRSDLRQIGIRGQPGALWQSVEGGRS
jgi:hypothetical protein